MIKLKWLYGISLCKIKLEIVVDNGINIIVLLVIK